MRSLNVLLAALCLAACGEPGANAPASAPTASQEPTRLQTIPRPFHGVWAATVEDCAKPAETRLEITAERLKFYESSGPVASVDTSDPSEILITVALTGEGAASQRTFRYRLIDDGSALFDVRNGLRRVRCPTA